MDAIKFSLLRLDLQLQPARIDGNIVVEGRVLLLAGRRRQRRFQVRGFAWCCLASLCVSLSLSLYSVCLVGLRQTVCLSASLPVCLSCFSASLFLCISLPLCLCVFVSLYLCLSVSPSLFLFLCLSLCLSLSVCLSLFLSVCLPPPPCPPIGRLLTRPDFQVQSKARPTDRPCFLSFSSQFSHV